MSKGKGGAGRTLVIVAVVAVLVATLSCCCGCGGFAWWGPSWLVSFMFADQPLVVPEVAPDPAVASRLERAFEAGGEVRITGDELVQLVDPASSSELEAFHVDVSDSQALLDVSIRVERGGYLNFHVLGEAVMENGYFTTLTLDELRVGTLDLTKYVAVQDLAPQANQNLAQKRAEDPDLDAALATVQSLRLEGDQVVVVLTEGGYEQLKALRDE